MVFNMRNAIQSPPVHPFPIPCPALHENSFWTPGSHLLGTGISLNNRRAQIKGLPEESKNGLSLASKLMLFIRVKNLLTWRVKRRYHWTCLPLTSVLKLAIHSCHALHAKLTCEVHAITVFLGSFSNKTRRFGYK